MRAPDGAWREGPRLVPGDATSMPCCGTGADPPSNSTVFPTCPKESDLVQFVELPCVP